MLDFSRVQNYYIACGYTDMRKQIDGLVAVVELQFKQKLNESSIFLFCGRRADRIKALYWDGTGYVLLYKRLQEKRFQWPRNEQELKLLTKQEFRWLMEGLSIPPGTVLLCLSPVSQCDFRLVDRSKNHLSATRQGRRSKVRLDPIQVIRLLSFGNPQEHHCLLC